MIRVQLISLQNSIKIDEEDIVQTEDKLKKDAKKTTTTEEEIVRDDLLIIDL